jgi:transglutaminase-like putative cysteine protease
VDVKKTLKGIAGLLEGVGVLMEVAEERKVQRARDRTSLARVHGGNHLGRAQVVRKKDPYLVDDNMKMKVFNVRSLDQRVKYIQKLTREGRDDPRIRALAVKIVSQKCGKKHCISEKDYVSEVRAIFNYMRKNVRYVRDAVKRDTFQSATRTLEFGGGDCDDYSITMGALLESIGYPIKLRVIQTTDADDWNHIYIIVGIPPGDPNQKWMSLDASLNRPAGWAPPKSMIAKIKDYDIT